MKYLKIDFNSISTDYLIRCNDKTLRIRNAINSDEKIFKSLIRLKEICNINTGFAFKSEDYEESGVKIFRISNIDNEKNEYVYLPDNYKDCYKKYLLKNEDIIIGLTGDGKIKVDYINQDNQFLLNQRVASLRIKNNLLNNRFLYYCLKYSTYISKQFLYYSNGKTQLNISPFDLLQIKIPKIPFETQNQTVVKIEPIEQQIKELKSQIIDQKLIINEVFAQEFGFDANLYNEFGKGMTAGTQIAEDKKLRVFDVNFSAITNSSTLRFSTRFHNQETRKLMGILNKIKTMKVKDVTQEYQKGIQPNYIVDGEIPVVKITNLKNSYIDFFETTNISQKDFNRLSSQKKLIYNDVILCATGKISLGKIDYYNYDQEAITTVDNYILRIKEKYHSLFFVYFFRSILGYFQIERDFTGATNQIHLYWEQISNFQIPNIPFSHQQEIVNKIQTKVDAQNKITKQIQALRNKIDDIMNEVIHNAH